MKQDPVCLMDVNEAKAVTTECDGVMYYFCSEGCRDKFLKDRTCVCTAYDLNIVGSGPAISLSLPQSRFAFRRLDQNRLQAEKRLAN